MNSEPDITLPWAEPESATCAHPYWLVMPSLNRKTCYDCPEVRPIDPNKPMLKEPEPKK